MFLLFSLAWWSMAPTHAAAVRRTQAVSPHETKRAETRETAALSTAGNVAFLLTGNETPGANIPEYGTTSTGDAAHEDAQNTGKLADEGGSGSPGVNIVIEGNVRGHGNFDSDGAYTIVVPSDESVLIFSFMELYHAEDQSRHPRL